MHYNRSQAKFIPPKPTKIKLYIILIFIALVTFSIGSGDEDSNLAIFSLIYALIIAQSEIYCPPEWRPTAISIRVILTESDL